MKGTFCGAMPMWVCQPGEKDTPSGVFERHRLKGAKEQGFSQVLSGLDLHHPPCSNLIANQAFYAIAMLAWIPKRKSGHPVMQVVDSA